MEREKRDKALQKLKILNDSSISVEQDIIRRQQIEESKVNKFMITSHLIAY